MKFICLLRGLWCSHKRNSTMLFLSPQEIWEQKFREAIKPKWSQSVLHNKYFFWSNPINHNSLRLNRTGAMWLHKTSTLPRWRVDMKTPPTLSILTKLERTMTSPYFIRNHEKIELFDIMHSSMLLLNDGDLEKYLDDLLS